MSDRKVTKIQVVYNEGAKSIFTRYLVSQYIPATDQFSVQITSTYDGAKNPDEHRVELQLFLKYDELRKFHDAVSQIG